MMSLQKQDGKRDRGVKTKTRHLCVCASILSATELKISGSVCLQEHTTYVALWDMCTTKKKLMNKQQLLPLLWSMRSGRKMREMRRKRKAVLFVLICHGSVPQMKMAGGEGG